MLFTGFLYVFGSKSILGGLGVGRLHVEAMANWLMKL
jgi:hypothetical protein